MGGARVARSGLAAGVLACLLAALVPTSMAAAGPREERPRAVLDGKPIALADVGDYFCHDFAFPEIQCYSDAAALEAALGSPGDASLDASFQVTAAAAGVTYVTIYDGTYYQGGYMHLSQDYWSLASIGWNDRISSFVVRNSQSGAFYTDWLNGGTQYNFCCNSSVSSLGSYDNTFSSVNQN